MRKLYTVRKIKDLKDLLSQSANLFIDKDAFRLRMTDGSYTGISYGRFKNNVDELGTALLSLGLKGAVIAVIGENRYEWCMTYLAVVNGVGTIVPMDKELPFPEITHLLEHCNAQAIVFSGKYTGDMKKLSEVNPSIRYYINMDSEQDQDFYLSLKRLTEKGGALLETGLSDFTEAVIDPEAMGILLYTSGTTGFAKGVMLSHRNICANIMGVCATVYVDSEDSSLSILPLHHTYACTIEFLCMMYSGACISFNDSLKQISRNLKEVKPTILVSVPLLLENMYRKIWDSAGKKPGGKTKLRIALGVGAFLKKALGIDIQRKLFKPIHDNIGGRLRLIVTGAAAIDPLVSRGFRWMGIKVLQGYGLTECSPLVTGNRDNAFVDRSAGLPVPGVEVRINQPDEHGVGEIIVRGSSVMLGYFKNEEATRQSIREGWFYTGDLGRMDAMGFLYITGRSKNVIVTKNGKNIYPEELEAMINKNPLVQESLVWGKIDKASGETRIYAQILPNIEAIKCKLKTINISGEEISKVLGDVVKSVNKSVPLYKHIHKFTIRSSEFAKTTTQKIKRYLEKDIEDGLDGGQKM